VGVVELTAGKSSGDRRGFERAARKEESTSTIECGVHLGKAVLSSRASRIKAILRGRGRQWQWISTRMW
jgi:hypothetical protein